MQSFTSLWVHYVWTTKRRAPLIVQEMKRPLYDAIRQICKGKGYYFDHINGIEDHVHLLIGLHQTQAVSTVAKDIKGLSQRWAIGPADGSVYFDFDWWMGRCLHRQRIGRASRTTLHRQPRSTPRAHVLHRRMELAPATRNGTIDNIPYRPTIPFQWIAFWPSVAQGFIPCALRYPALSHATCILRSRMNTGGFPAGSQLRSSITLASSGALTISYRRAKSHQ